MQWRLKYCKPNRSETKILGTEPKGGFNTSLNLTEQWLQYCDPNGIETKILGTKWN